MHIYKLTGRNLTKSRLFNGTMSGTKFTFLSLLDTNILYMKL